MERLSISLDDETLSIIEKYLPKYQGSKADLIRRALHCLEYNEEIQKKTTMENINAYIEFLANMEHIMLDISIWKAIFSEIGKGTDEFWDEVFKIGGEHKIEYFDRGIKNIQDILKSIEKTNVYKLNIDSPNSYTLILAVSESSKFVKTFFEGLFSKFSKKFEIIEEYKKIRIRVV
jgi:hypothetical protein